MHKLRHGAESGSSALLPLAREVMMRTLLRAIAAFTLSSQAFPAFCATPPEALGDGVPKFTVRDGYKVTLAADGLSECRFLEFDDKGTLYVSQNRAGNIVALMDKDKDGVFETSAEFIKGKQTAHGMHFKDGWLWFSQSGAIHKAKDSNGDGVADEVVTVIADDGTLPKGGGHWWRSIFVADDGFYTSIGDAQNASDQLNTDRQKIWKFSLDGKEKKLIAGGVRNTEKLRYRPGTTELWGCDHNSDNFGASLGEVSDVRRGLKQPITDAFPPEELNHYVEGGYYGHPFLVGNRVPRIEFHNRPDLLELAAKTTVPALQFGPHWAGNGWTFITKEALGADLKGDMLVAFHGSWNSSNKVGYRVERVTFDKVTGKPYGHYMLVGTLSEDGKTALARPVDVVEAADGSVLFSCDQTKKVFRITKLPVKTAAAN